jgi:hypothetical protein
MLRFSKSSAQHDIQHLQKQNGKALSYLLEVNAAQGSYQVSQAELSANRHHFDQSYRIDESRPGSRTPGRQASPEQRAKYDERLSKSGEGSLQSLTDHLDLVDKGVSEEEIIRAKELIKGRIILSMEDTFNVADMYGKQMLHEGKLRTVDQTIAKISAVTTEQVQALAKELYIQKHLNLALIGPFKKESEFLDLLK